MKKQKRHFYNDLNVYVTKINPFLTYYCKRKLTNFRLHLVTAILNILQSGLRDAKNDMVLVETGFDSDEMSE